MEGSKMTTREFRVITICGSMRYYDEMLIAAQTNTRLGYIVLMPFVADFIGGITANTTKIMLDKMHLAKIDMSQAVLIVGEHVGESTSKEIAYAQETGKEIIYWDRVMR
jgi:hypothetical protein